MNEPVKLVTTKSDQDRANEIRQEIIQASQPLLDVMTKVGGEGFTLGLRFGPNAFKQIIIQELTIGKQF